MILDLLLIAIGLSMDAFSVSICKGLAVCKVKFKHMMLAGLWFGLFQALMPLIGYLLGSAFESYIKNLDHWIALVLLAFIGGKMIKESFENGECCSTDASFGFTTMLVMAVATSIDALAIGVSFAFLGVNIWSAIALIGVTTGLFSAAGVYIGKFFGMRYKSKAEFTGGFILIAMGLKILLEHTL